MKPVPNQARSLAVLILAVVAGCGEPSAPVTTAPADPWFNPPPDSVIETEPVAPAAYAPVAAERIAEAEAFLASEGISQISPAEVSYFAGRDIALPGVSRPWLVRGLYRTTPTFTVSIAGNALWVASADQPGDAAPVRHQPLVLVMDEVPETVYVTAGTAR